MDVLNNLMLGAQVALTPANLMYCFIGSLVGTLIGVLPGLGPTAGIAVLIPISIGLPPASAMIMLTGIYYGAMYGGSTTSVLLNVPGEASSVVTALDGYKLARKGRAGPALGMAAIASFIAGTVSLVGLTLLAPPLADIAIDFGPPEYFTLMLLGLTLIIGLSGRSLLKGVIAGVFGLMIAMIGQDPMTGLARYTFGNLNLLGGIDFISVAVGLFAFAEILSNAEAGIRQVYSGKLHGLLPTLQDWRDAAGALVRSSLLGFFIGIIPGGSPTVASFLAYDVERRASRHPEKFGTGTIEGVAAPEGANNAAVGGGLIPMLTLGIPPSAPLAVLLGALMVHGVRPGPTMFEQYPQVVWGLIVSMYVGNIMLLVLNLPLVGLWARLITVPYPLLAPIVLVLCVIGTYSIRNNLTDVWIAIIFGVIGFVMRKLDIPAAPVVLTLVLSHMFENALRQSMVMSGGDAMIFLTRPMSLALVIAVIVLLIASALEGKRTSRLRMGVQETEGG